MASARTLLKELAIGVCGKLVCMNSRLCGLRSAADLCLAGMPRKRSANAGASMPEKSVAKVKSEGSWVLLLLSCGGICRRPAFCPSWPGVTWKSFIAGGCEKVVPRVVLKRDLWKGLVAMVSWDPVEPGSG